MKHLLDAFWRAAAYCLHPRVVMWSLLPLFIAGGLVAALGYFFWEPAVDAVGNTLRGWLLTASLLQWLDAIGAGGVRAMLAPLVVVALALPVVVVFSLLLVAMLMTPSLTRLVAQRRFPLLERKHGAGWWASAAWSVGCTLLALVVLAASIPLWFIPPLVLIVPPLIWGWLSYRVMVFDVLADHASGAERRALLRAHRWPLLAMGIVTGYLGAAPTLLWAMSAITFVLAPFLVLFSVWLYTLVFAFSALWFAHYALGALQTLRRVPEAVLATASPADPAALPPLTPTLLP